MEDKSWIEGPVIRAMIAATAASSVLRPGRILAQEASAKPMPEGNTIYLNPARADTNSGAKGSPLRTLAEAARRVNQSRAPGR